MLVKFAKRKHLKAFILPVYACFSVIESAYEQFSGFRNLALEEFQQPGITIVNSKQKAHKAISVLEKLTDRIHAWDTETIDVEVREESPVGHGKIICASAFCGPEVDFGNGPRLFIDNFGQNKDLILLFKDYFENPKYFKCWHNYGFDRHILFNHGINALGFGGDTMHMARLLDPSRELKGYSLSHLTFSYRDDLLIVKRKIVSHLESKLPPNDPRQKSLQLYKKFFLSSLVKKSMTSVFGRAKILKTGSPGKTIEIPSIVEMHTNKELLPKWIEYSTLDAEVTFFLREYLLSKLKEHEIDFEGMKNLMDLYNKYWLPLGETLTDMEREGIKVNVEYLDEIRVKAEQDKKVFEEKFLQWVRSIQEDTDEFNPSSVAQLQQLLFAPFRREKVKKAQTDNEDDEEGLDFEEAEIEEPKRKNKRNDQDEFPVERAFTVLNTKNIIEPGKKAPLKNREMIIRGLGIPSIKPSASGLPSVDTSVLKALAGNPDSQKYGKAYDFFKANGKPEFGIQVCDAISNLLKYRSTETLLQTFIIPLSQMGDANSRIHCSLNLNTETGRLSSSKPNLQNQPALEKDKYKIRKAFIPEKGKKFIVADYGQIELRVLAHMTDCQSMIEAFVSGQDIHSRTVIGMYPEIKKELEEGKLLLEWDSKKGPPPAPLLKDKYGSERRKAKGLNFSIAYGKSAHGFAKDWGCSIEEANDVVNKWYADRKEIKEWQDKAKKTAIEQGWTRTLMGRYRNLSSLINSAQRSKTGHGLRAAINTPIQGGAADIVIAAMVKLNYDEKLREMGWRLLLQIHDEVIMEGPEESAPEALKRVIELMEHPLENPLKISLDVSAAICNNWYEAK